MAFTTVQSTPQLTTLSPSEINSTNPVQAGQKFFKDGCWWEVVHCIDSFEESHCYCRPIILTEGKMFSAQDVQNAVKFEGNGRIGGAWAGTPPTKAQAKAQDGRGSGRRLTLVHSTDQPRNSRTFTHRAQSQKEVFKLLAIGSRQTIDENIRKLHLLGYADLHLWSRMLPAPHKGEYMSILIHKNFRLTTN